MNKSILIADDDVDIQLLLSHHFLKQGLYAEFSYLNNGQDVVNYMFSDGGYPLEKHRDPDFIVMDINMPEMTGREALLKIKAHPKYAKLPVFMISADLTEIDENYLLDFGATSCMKKPDTASGYSMLASMIKKSYSTSKTEKITLISR